MADDSGAHFEPDGQAVLALADLPGAHLLTEDELSGRYTAERLRSQRPAIYAECVRMLSGGASMRAVTRALGLHHYTICAVANAEPIAIEALKKRNANLARIGATLTVETIIEAVSDAARRGDLTVADAQRLAIVFGVLTDKSELLSGGATARVAHRQEDMAEASAAIYDLPSDAVVEAEADDVPVMGFDAGAGGTKGAGPVGPARVDQGGADAAKEVDE